MGRNCKMMEEGFSLRTTMQRRRMSLFEMGLFAYILAKPIEWEVDIDEIVSMTGDSREEVERGLCRLAECGLLM